MTEPPSAPSRAMAWIAYAFAGTLFALLCGCVALETFDPYWRLARDIKIDGHYRLQAADDPGDLAIVYAEARTGEVRIPGPFQAYGFDQKYIVAVQSGERYYYIDRSVDGLDKLPSVAVHGPLNRQSFDRVAALLQLPTPIQKNGLN